MAVTPLELNRKTPWSVRVVLLWMESKKCGKVLRIYWNTSTAIENRRIDVDDAIVVYPQRIIPLGMIVDIRKSWRGRVPVSFTGKAARYAARIRLARSRTKIIQKTSRILLLKRAVMDVRKGMNLKYENFRLCLILVVLQ